jgi:8-oxo-dGTP diphosphatase
MTDRFMVVPAAYVYLLRDDDGDRHGRQVLLQLREGTGFMDGHWAAAVAGHVERGESVFEAATREAAEEVGIREVALVPWCAMQRTAPTGDPVDERVDYFFTATSWLGEPRIVEPDKCADLRWFGLDALPDPVVPHELRVLESIRAGAVPAILTHGF